MSRVCMAAVASSQDPNHPSVRPTAWLHRGKTFIALLFSDAAIKLINGSASKFVSARSSVFRPSKCVYAPARLGSSTCRWAYIGRLAEWGPVVGPLITRCGLSPMFSINIGLMAFPGTKMSCCRNFSYDRWTNAAADIIIYNVLLHLMPRFYMVLQDVTAITLREINLLLPRHKQANHRHRMTMTR